MSSSTTHLLLLQIGPVQDFITAARTPDDLWSGSYLIAHLTASGIKYVKDYGGKIVFPCLENQTVFEYLCGETSDLGQPTLPNRFLALIPAGKARDIASGAAGAIRAKQRKGNTMSSYTYIYTHHQRQEKKSSPFTNTFTHSTSATCTVGTVNQQWAYCRAIQPDCPIWAYAERYSRIAPSGRMQGDTAGLPHLGVCRAIQPDCPIWAYAERYSRIAPSGRIAGRYSRIAPSGRMQGDTAGLPHLGVCRAIQPDCPIWAAWRL